MNKKVALMSILPLCSCLAAIGFAINNNGFTTQSIKNVSAVNFEDVAYNGYRRTTNINMLVTGAKVMIVRYESGGYYATSSNTHSFSGYNVITPTEVYLKNNAIVSYDDYYVIHRNESNRYAFQTKAGEDTYVSLSGDHLYTNSSIFYFNVSFASSVRVQSGSKYISYYSNSGGGFCSSSSTVSGNSLYIDADSVLQAWITNFMHMEENVSGQCVSYFPLAKVELLKYDNTVIADLINNDSYNDVQERYEAWADALHEKPYEE